MDASQLPQVDQDPNALDFAARYAPIILADEREPFTLCAVGYTIFDRAGESPSFVPRRRVDWDDAGYPATRAIEYALWWDWDIGHLYYLEHAWTFINASGRQARARGEERGGVVATFRINERWRQGEMRCQH